MKIIIDHELLKHSLNITHRVSYDTSNDKNLNVFFIECEKDQLIISVKNDFIIIKKTLQTGDKLKILESGKIIVRAQIFNELIQKTSGEITIDNPEQNLIIVKTKNYRTEINCLPLSFWTLMNTNFISNSNNNFSLGSVALTQIIRQIGHSVQTKESEEIFHGVNFRTTNKKLAVTGTDGSRIAIKELFDIDNDVDFVVPFNSLNEINRIVGLEKVSELKLTIDKQFLLVNIKTTTLQLKLIDGKFPDAESQVKSTLAAIETTLTYDRLALIKAIEKASLFFEKDTIPMIVFRINKNQGVISSPKNEVGFFEEKLKDAVINGKEQEVSLQSKFVLNVLKPLSGQEVTVQFSANEGPVLFTEKNDLKTKWLILPFWL